jgi:hypothetical protein
MQPEALGQLVGRRGATQPAQEREQPSPRRLREYIVVPV